MDRKNRVNLLDLTPEEKKSMLEDITYFFETERDEKIGIIGSEQVLDFFLQTLGDKIYNKALDDANRWYKRVRDNMESDFYALYKE